jgi:glycosyltransferase involved in cell wall biosynthesis
MEYVRTRVKLNRKGYKKNRRMESNIKISLIIPFYKRLDFLELIFQALGKQSFKAFELIVAEDDDDAQTKAFITQKRAMVNFPVEHVFQEDDGFRKSKIMNKAILKAKGLFLVYIDGDCIPHQHFLKEYAKNMEDGFVLFGRRVKMSKQLTDILLRANSIKKINLLNLMLSKSERIEDGVYLPFRTYSKTNYRGICGCNWGTYKRYLLNINGFDEDFIGIGEDVDIEWRLALTEVKLKRMKNKAIVYHLFHDENYSKEQVEMFVKMLDGKKQTGIAVCRNGIEKL